TLTQPQLGNRPRLFRPGDRVDSVVTRVLEPDRLTESTRPPCQIAPGASSALDRDLKPLDDLTRAQQHSPGLTGGPAYDVHARVDAMTEIHIEVPRLAPHRRVPGRSTHPRVGSRVWNRPGPLAVVGLDFGDAQPHLGA